MGGTPDISTVESESGGPHTPTVAGSPRNEEYEHQLFMEYKSSPAFTLVIHIQSVCDDLRKFLRQRTLQGD